MDYVYVVCYCAIDETEILAAYQYEEDAQAYIDRVAYIEGRDVQYLYIDRVPFRY